MRQVHVRLPNRRMTKLSSHLKNMTGTYNSSSPVANHGVLKSRRPMADYDDFNGRSRFTYVYIYIYSPARSTIFLKSDSTISKFNLSEFNKFGSEKFRLADQTHSNFESNHRLSKLD